MKPGDIIYCPDTRFGHHRFYQIEGCHYGALGQESLIELRNLTEKPGVDGQHTIQTTLVPEPLLRHFTCYTPDISSLTPSPPPTQENAP